MNKKILGILEKFGYEIAEQCGDNCIHEITVSSEMFRQLDESIKGLAAYSDVEFKTRTASIRLAMPFGYVTVKENKE